jgi:hypothetical protein
MLQCSPFIRCIPIILFAGQILNQLQITNNDEKTTLLNYLLPYKLGGIAQKRNRMKHLHIHFR